MAVIVQKYGGTSVGDIDRIGRVADRVVQLIAEHNQVIVVVSAMSGETNRLEALGRSLAGPADADEMDVLLTSGEQVSTALLSMALRKRGQVARSFLGPQIPIRTDGNHGRARIESIPEEGLRAALASGVTPVVAGFQGQGADGRITTLGRGGSDTTAVAIAAALVVDECQICTDVDGVYTADPRIEPDAKKLEQVTFEEMLELASLGSKVLHPRSVEFAGKYRVPLRVVSTFEPGSGTLITIEGESTMEQAVVSGIAHTSDEAKITVLGVPDTPGIASKILGPIGREDIEVDMILQNTGADGLTDFTFTVKRVDFDRALTALQHLKQQLGVRDVVGDNKIAKVSVVGVGMRSHAGVAARMFDALAQENINIQMISTSEIKISVVVAERYMELAVRSIHAAFDLADGA